MTMNLQPPDPATRVVPTEDDLIDDIVELILDRDDDIPIGAVVQRIISLVRRFDDDYLGAAPLYTEAWRYDPDEPF